MRPRYPGPNKIEEAFIQKIAKPTVPSARNKSAKVLLKPLKLLTKNITARTKKIIIPAFLNKVPTSVAKSS